MKVTHKVIKEVREILNSGGDYSLDEAIEVVRVQYVLTAEDIADIKRVLTT